MRLINMPVIKLTIPGAPIAKKRPRMNTKTGAVYNSQKVEENRIRTLVLNALKGPLEPLRGPLSVKMTFYTPMSVAASKKAFKTGYDDRINPIPDTKRPDLDNLIKFVADLLNMQIYIDDCQIYKLDAAKYLSLNPRTEIEIIF